MNRKAQFTKKINKQSETLSIVEKYERYFCDKIIDISTIPVSYNDKVERIANEIYFFTSAKPPHPDNMESLMEDTIRMNDMVVCSHGQKEAYSKIKEWCKEKGSENLDNDIKIKLDKLNKNHIPKWLKWQNVGKNNYTTEEVTKMMNVWVDKNKTLNTMVACNELLKTNT
jgi:hypothetical protein